MILGGFVDDDGTVINKEIDLSDEEYARTTAAKQRDSKQGHQFSAQPADVAVKTRPFRDHRTHADLYAEATKRGVPGRSRMTRDQLLAALAD